MKISILLSVVFNCIGPFTVDDPEYDCLIRRIPAYLRIRWDVHVHSFCYKITHYSFANRLTPHIFSNGTTQTRKELSSFILYLLRKAINKEKNISSYFSL